MTTSISSSLHFLLFGKTLVQFILNITKGSYKSLSLQMLRTTISCTILRSNNICPFSNSSLYYYLSTIQKVDFYWNSIWGSFFDFFNNSQLILVAVRVVTSIWKKPAYLQYKSAFLDIGGFISNGQNVCAG